MASHLKNLKKEIIADQKWLKRTAVEGIIEKIIIDQSLMDSVSIVITVKRNQ